MVYPDDSSLPPTMTPPPGTMGEGSPWARVLERLRELTRGEYEIQRELGRGGMAAVYLAHDLALDRRVAIKVMSPALLSGEGMVARFQREAITVAKLDHPNIITIHAVRQREELHFLVLKFVEGRSLESILEASGPLPIPIARALLHQVGQALAYAHRRGVVHRDVKPANILVDVDGNAIVTDFGIAKVAESTSQTQTGTIVGTPVYISPEQCFAETASGLSDQYSLGVVAFEMLTGRPPFTGTGFVIMRAHCEQPVPSIRGLRPDVPPELEQAILRMLAKAPEDRWATMSHALVAMEAKPLGEHSSDRERLMGMATPDYSMPAVPSPTTPSPVTRSGLTTQATVTSMELVSPATRLEAGDRARLELMARDETGAIVVPSQVRWTVEPAALAAIDDMGTLTSLAAGTVTVTAATTQARTQATITITPPRVAAVTITAPPGTLRAGSPIQLVATPYDRRKAPMRRGMIWQLLDGRATLSDDGVLVAECGGPVTVAAEAEGVRGELGLKIADARIVEIRIAGAERVRAGEQATFAVEAFGEREQRVTVSDDSPPVWMSTDDAVAQIGAGGALVARTPGLATIEVEWQGRSARKEIEVVAVTAKMPPLVAAAPTHDDDASALDAPPKRRSRLLLLVGLGVATLAIAAFALMSRRGGDGAAAPAAVDSAVTVTATAPGASAAATASIGTPEAGAAATPAAPIAPAAIARIRIAPVRPLLVGDRRRLTATALDSAGGTMLGAAARWSSSDTAVARVDSTGLLTGLSPGTASLIAQLGDKRERVRVTVRAALPSADTLGLILADYLGVLRARDRARLESLAAAAPASRQEEARALAELVRSYSRIETSDLIVTPLRAEGDAAVAGFTFVLRGRATLRRDPAPRTIVGEVRLERKGAGWALVAAYPTSGAR